MKFAPVAIPAMALLQQHDARWDIVIELAACRRAAIAARGHSELRAFGTGDVRNWGHNWAIKTHRLVLYCCNITLGVVVMSIAIMKVRLVHLMNAECRGS